MASLTKEMQGQEQVLSDEVQGEREEGIHHSEKMPAAAATAATASRKELNFVSPDDGHSKVSASGKEPVEKGATVPAGPITFRFRGLSIWVLLRGASSAGIRGLTHDIRELCPDAGSFATHLTLQYGLDKDKVDVDTLEQLIKEAIETEGVKPFSLVPRTSYGLGGFAFGDYTPFKMRYWSIHYKVGNTLKRLWTALKIRTVGMGGSQTGLSGFAPHAAVLYLNARDGRFCLEDAVELMGKNARVLEENPLVSSVCIVDTEGDVRDWRVLREIPLGSGKKSPILLPQ